MKKYKASISIYFVFAILLIISVILSVSEITRMTCQKLYLQVAADSSIDSMLSLYERKLANYYNIYGVEYLTENMLCEEYYDFLEPYIKDENGFINNWYIATIDKNDIVLNYKLLIEENYFEKQIINYMKIAMLGKTIDFIGEKVFIDKEDSIKQMADIASDIQNTLKKNDIYKEVYEKYFDFSKDIKKLEQYVRTVSSHIDTIRNNFNYFKNISIQATDTNVENIKTKLMALFDTLEKEYAELEKIEEKLNDFRGVILSNKSKFYADKSVYEFSEDVEQYIIKEFEYFEKIVHTDGEWAKAITKCKNECINNKEALKKHYENIVSLANEIESLEKNLADAKKEKGEDRDSDEISQLKDEIKYAKSDFSEHLKSIKEDISTLIITDITISVSKNKTSTNETKLNKILNFKNSLILDLVLDSDEKEQINTNDIMLNDIDITSSTNTFSIDKILLGEYALDKFNYFTKNMQNEITKSGSTALEVEKILYDKPSDTANLEKTVTDILLMRTAMNILYIYSDGEKRAIATNTARMLFSGFSELMVQVMALLFISAWGTVQGVVDVKKLLKGKKVKLMHDNNSWTVDAKNVINIVSGENMDIDENDDSGVALSYKDYLRVLLLKTNQSFINKNMAGIIEVNLKKENARFDFQKLICIFQSDINFVAKHFFTNLIWKSANDVKLFNKYVIKTSSIKGY